MGRVTFRDPDSARMACMDPYPFFSVTRLNCKNGHGLNYEKKFFLLFNVVIIGPIGPIMPYNGGAAVPGGMYVPSPTYQQPPYNYSQALVYPPYGPSTYGPEYLYPQNAYGPYVGQQYVPVTFSHYRIKMLQMRVHQRFSNNILQVTFSHYRIKMLQMRVHQRFSNNILQELHALSNSSCSLLACNSSHQTMSPNKCRDDKRDAGDKLEVPSSLQQD
uniref:Uncharacterized protein n=1 Tax=Aegilops tauschii TaxID=37682 RepID=M8BK91_AEGTA